MGRDSQTFPRIRAAKLLHQGPRGQYQGDRQASVRRLDPSTDQEGGDDGAQDVGGQVGEGGCQGRVGTTVGAGQLDGPRDWTVEWWRVAEVCYRPRCRSTGRRVSPSPPSEVIWQS